MIDVKGWLERYKEMVTLETIAADRLEMYRAKAKAPAHSALDGMPRSPGYVGDPLGRKIAQIERLEAELTQRSREALELYNEITDTVAQIGGKNAARKQAVLLIRYLDGLPWADVSFSLWGDRPDYIEKEDSYLRRTFQAHRSALEALERIILETKKGANEDEGEIAGSVVKP